MTCPPYEDGSPRVLRPARHPHGGLAGHRLQAGSCAVLTFWLHSPYQRLPRGLRCPPGALTRHRARSVHERRATDVRRGTDLLVGHSRARGVKAGVRTLSGKHADGGPRAGWRPGAGEAPSAHAPARPLVTGRRGGTASTRPAGTARGTRAESADTRLTARPSARMRPRHGAWSAPSLAIFRLPPCSVWEPRRALVCAGTDTVHARKGTSSHDFACQPAFRSAALPDSYPAGDPLPRPAGPPAAPGGAVGAGQRRNIPATQNQG
jgi:hypothetical protein